MKKKKCNHTALCVISIGLMVTGCDLFNARLDEDVAARIDQAVWEANAPVLNVVVDEGGMGTASPRGTLQGIKQTIPFTLNYAAKTEFPFTGWQARLGPDIIAVWKPDGAGGISSGAGKVSFEPQNSAGTETRVTIHINPAGQSIVLGPLGADLPEINVEFDPGNHGSFQQRPGQIKLGVPFTVNFDPYVGYYFVEWRVYRDAVQDDKLLSPEAGEVAFTNRDERQTQITVNVNTGGKIIVLAHTDTSPSLLFQEPDLMRFSSTSSPGGSLSVGDIIPNTYVRFTFSKPMDPAGFSFRDTVLITEKNTSASNESEHYESWYNPQFSLDYTRVTFYRCPSRVDTAGFVKRGWPASTEYPNVVSIDANYDTTYTITLTGELRSRAGFPIGRDAAVRYTVKGHGNTTSNLDLSTKSQVENGSIAWAITESALNKSGPENWFFRDNPTPVSTIKPLSDEKMYIVIAVSADTCQPLRGMLINEDGGTGNVFGDYRTPMPEGSQKTRVLDALRKKAAGTSEESILKNIGYVFEYEPNINFPETPAPGNPKSGFPHTPGTQVEMNYGLRTWVDDPDLTDIVVPRGESYSGLSNKIIYYIGTP
jgi:hypothetical protein